jgi:Xaa-Pro aminopeptidase
MVREVKTEHTFGDKQFLVFEHVTMVPYCRSLIDEGLLTDEEKAWLNEGHKVVRERMERLLAGDELAWNWVERETRPF